ncbi:Glutamyl/glutaminyl-tRNA synthetase [Hyaloraphidium curvatum]|nr:Glutamyl/glutaminyl-tRNA synthetase [Hyaloraphidium curvatum]
MRPRMPYGARWLGRLFSSGVHGPVRVRFAPSPTGLLHLGGLRTALFNYLFARKNGGAFVLRVEDTDQARLVAGSVAHIADVLAWAGLSFDEGPDLGGAYGPYVQSQRLPIYREHVQRLVLENNAYRCFCSSGRVEALRARASARGGPTGYDKHCSRLSRRESDARAESGEQFVIRMRVPSGSTTFNDLVYGRVSFDNSQIDDAVLLKSDGWPTYHLANVVDDHLMRITHVMRGEEWITSTPKHVILYDSFGWRPPAFAHLPLLHNTDKTKLSKRNGDVHLESFRRKGYLPSALLNFVALLGWGPHGVDAHSFMSLPDMVEKFDLAAIGSSGAVVSYEKLDSLNKLHFAAMCEASDGREKVLGLLRQSASLWLSDDSSPYLSPDYLSEVLDVVKPKVTVVTQLASLSRPFFAEPDLASDESRNFKSQLSEAVAISVLRQSLWFLDAAEFGSDDTIKTALRGVQERANVSYNQVMSVLRWAVSGTKVGVSVVGMMRVLGKTRTLGRLHKAVDSLGR